MQFAGFLIRIIVNLITNVVGICLFEGVVVIVISVFDMVGSSKGSSSLSKVLSSMVCGAKDGRPRTINIFLGFFLMINIVLGTGFLSIPYGFYHSGVLPSIVTLLLANFITWLCAVWVVETMARAQVSAL